MGLGRSSMPMPSRSIAPSRGFSPSMSRPMPSIGRPSVMPSGPSPSRPSMGRLPSRLPATGGIGVRPSFGMPSGALPSNRLPSGGLPSTRLPSAGVPSTRLPSGGLPSTRLPSGGVTRPNPSVLPSLGATPGVGARPGNLPAGRPTQGQISDFLELNRPSTLPATRPGGGAAGDFLQRNRPANLPASGGEPSNLPAGRPGVGGRPSQLPASPDGNAPGQRPPGQKPPGVKPPSGGQKPPGAGHHPSQRPPSARPPGYRPPGARPPGYRPPGYRPPRPGYLPIYGIGFWDNVFGWRWGWNGYGHNWWAWGTVGNVSGWCLGDVRTPIYYDYGTNLYYDGGNVVYNGQVVATADQYAQQAQAIVSNIPDVDVKKVEWLPLGVFALTDTYGDVEDSTLFLQLAISKERIIAGTFRNTATDSVFEVEGTIDEKSQRAAWGPIGEEWPIMETGIFNLTENEAGALLHFADGQTQQWTMVRLDDPQEQKP